MLFLLMLLGCVKELKNAVIYKGKGDLTKAAKEGRKSDIINLLTRGENINEIVYGETPLYVASYNGHKEVVELLLAKGAEIDKVGIYTALYGASSNGQKEVVELLLTKGAEIDKFDDGYGTALYGASYNGHKEVVELLLTKGAEIDKVVGLFGTALYGASENGHKEVVELLLTKGAEIDKDGGIYGTALYIASSNGHKEVVELLLAKGAVDIRHDRNIYTFISNKQNKNSDKLLLIRANLNKSKNLNDTDESLVCSVFECDDTDLLIFILDTLKENNTITDDFLLNIAALAIELKAFNSLKEVFFSIKDRQKIDVLIDREDLSQLVNLNKPEILAILAEVDQANLVKKDLLGNDLPKISNIKKGKGDLIKAAARGQVDDVLFLIESGEDINELDQSGQTPLYIASYHGHLEVAKILILKGASIDLANMHGETPLYKASQRGLIEMVELLLAKGAAVNLADNGSQTPLYTASQRGNLEVVEVLIKNGASIDLASVNGWSPLLVATQYGNVELIRLLISNGAAISQTNKAGETPLSLAQKYNYEEVIKILTGE